MARRAGGPGITLFSFQDIITSVSGIMIFITLMLALELMDKSDKKGSAAAAARDAVDLKARIAAARAERDELKRRALAASRSTGRSSLADERAAQEAAERVEQAERDLAALEKRANAAREREEEAKTRKEGVAAATEEEGERKKAELEALRGRLKVARNGDLVYFNFDGDPAKKRDGWLALVDGRAISVAPFGREMTPRSFVGPPDEEGKLDPASRAFVEWAAREARGSYILLVIRPSGSPRMGPIEEAFSQGSRAFGTDLVTETQEVLDPEKGVLRP